MASHLPYYYGLYTSAEKVVLQKPAENNITRIMTKYDIECLNKATSLIDKDPAKHYTIVEIAKFISFSPTKLKTSFKKLFGTGLYKYLLEKRMEKGKYLLENTEKTMKDISHSLGYKYTNNFSAAFKKQFGVSPTFFRNNN